MKIFIWPLIFVSLVAAAFAAKSYHLLKTIPVPGTFTVLMMGM